MSRRAVRYVCQDRAHKVQEHTLTGAVDLVWRNPSTGDLPINAPTLRIDPGGAGRTVDLPPEGESTGARLVLVNTADAAEDLTVRDDGGATTIVTISQNEEATVWCDGTAWHGNVNDVT